MAGRQSRRGFLERSLADLDAEHAVGDLSDDDHALLSSEYRRRLAQLDAKAPAPRARPGVAGPRRPRRPLRTAGVVAGVTAFAVLAGVLVAQSAGRRGVGDNVTGIDLSPSGTVDDPGEPDEQAGPVGSTTTVPASLGACFPLEGAAAIDCYIGFTRANPEEPLGFFHFGLFSVEQGIAAQSQELVDGGIDFLRRAVELDPGFVAARLNLAVVLERTGQVEEARAVFAPIEDAELPADLRDLGEFLRGNLADAAATTGTTAD